VIPHTNPESWNRTIELFLGGNNFVFVFSSDQEQKTPKNYEIQEALPARKWLISDIPEFLINIFNSVIYSIVPNATELDYLVREQLVQDFL
jgi:hypothetical protein